MLRAPTDGVDGILLTVVQRDVVVSPAARLAHRIVGMAPVDRIGEGCSDAVRALLEGALTGEKR